MNNLIYEDHLGNKYSSLKDMCKFYGVSRSLYSYRIKQGWSLKDALEKTSNHSTEVYDHKGKLYKNEAELCRAYGIHRKTYKSRIETGMSQKEALETPVQEYSVTDYKGNKYDSIHKMCEYYGINQTTYFNRIKRGMSQKEALTKAPSLTTNTITQYDHKGIKHESQKAMCDYWQISQDTFNRRIKSGLYSLEEALTLPLNSRKGKYNTKRCKDHLGKEFNSMSEMMQYYGISRSAFMQRLDSGMTLEEALAKPSMYLKGNPKSVVDYLGNKFGSIKEMCNYHHVKIQTYRGRIYMGLSLKEALSSENMTFKKIIDPCGREFTTITDMCNYWRIPRSVYFSRMHNGGWSMLEALSVPRNMYIGEYRVAECLKRLNVKFYHDCTIKTVFADLGISADWNDFLSELQAKLGSAGYIWSKQKIQRLRPDFVLYTDEDNKIRGVIEFDGEQHQNFVEFFFKTIEEFYKRCDTDFVKQSFWEYMNIPMLRIRHDQIDMIDDMVQDFIDNPQNYIHNHNTYLSEEEYWSILAEQKQQIELAFAA